MASAMGDAEAFEITATFEIHLRVDEDVRVAIQLDRAALIDEAGKFHHIAQRVARDQCAQRFMLFAAPAST